MKDKDRLIIEALTTPKPVIPPHKHHPGLVAYCLLVFFIALGGLGFLSLHLQARDERIAQCHRVNKLRWASYETIRFAEARVPDAQYTAETKAFYDRVISGFMPVDCSNLPRDSTPAPPFPPRRERVVVTTTTTTVSQP